MLAELMGSVGFINALFLAVPPFLEMGDTNSLPWACCCIINRNCHIRAGGKSCEEGVMTGD